MLKIRRSSDGGVFSLIGRIGVEDIVELQRLLRLEPAGGGMVLDLEDVTLVHREAVQFLAQCEAEGMKLDGCPAYIRNWIDTGTSRSRGTDAERP